MTQSESSVYARIRDAAANDQHPVMSLYRRVAATPGGLARLADEIDEDYVSNFMAHASQRGICLVAEDDRGQVVAEIHAYRPAPRCFSHVLSELTIAVDPAVQGSGVGRRIFESFMHRVVEGFPDIQRVELIARESNLRAIRFYASLGFEVEGKLSNRIKGVGGSFESDIPMAWLRPSVT